MKIPMRVVNKRLDEKDYDRFLALTYGIVNCERSALSHKAKREVIRIEYLRCEKDGLNETGMDI